MKIYFTNTLTKLKTLFEPIDPTNIRMYVCGPTVYDRPHLGNARSAVTYDILFRLLRSVYPNSSTYARNITDIDDKIIDACKVNDIDFLKLTSTITDYYHADISALNCLQPTYEPKATAYIKQMINMIEILINKGHAYVTEKHVLFSVDSYKDYGKLSNRNINEMIAGSRIEVAPHKRNPTDFVLWKPSPPEDERFGFDSPWGIGRPGWHIECSAMIHSLLGDRIDIHGGGADLMFPHHENEIAQSVCCTTQPLANYWVHNGFLMVNGEKMSKSLGNFKTVKEVLDEGIEGCVIRCFYLSAHYRKPIDFNNSGIDNAKKAISRFRQALAGYDTVGVGNDPEFMDYLADDLNTPLYLSKMHEYASHYLRTGEEFARAKLASACALIGLNLSNLDIVVPESVLNMAKVRQQARIDKKWDESDRLRLEIEKAGYRIEDDSNNNFNIKKI